MAAKYIVGIDLGTTNSALARCEVAAEDEQSRIEIQSIPQLVNPNEVADRNLLPSFLYVPGEFDFPSGSLVLAWDMKPRYVIGELARKRGAESPNRLVASAKSWLSYAAVNRHSTHLAMAGAGRSAKTLAARGIVAVPAISSPCLGQQQRGRSRACRARCVAYCTGLLR